MNGKKALDYVYRPVDGRTVPTPRVLLDIHAIVVGDDDTAWGGRIRDDARFIRGSMYVPPSARRASEMLDDVFEEYAQRRDTDHPVVVAADLHFGIVHVHPFKGGNGRTARLAMNVHLLQSGFPPLAIMPAEKPEYIETLEKAHFGDVEPFRRSSNGWSSPRSAGISTPSSARTVNGSGRRLGGRTDCALRERIRRVAPNVGHVRGGKRLVVKAPLYALSAPSAAAYTRSITTA